MVPLNQSPQRHSYISGIWGSLLQYPPLRQGSLSQAVSCTVCKIENNNNIKTNQSFWPLQLLQINYSLSSLDGRDISPLLVRRSRYVQPDKSVLKLKIVVSEKGQKLSTDRLSMFRVGFIFGYSRIKHNARYWERDSVRVTGLRCSEHNTIDWSASRSSLKSPILARMNAVTTRRNTWDDVLWSNFPRFQADHYMKTTIYICMIMDVYRNRVEENNKNVFYSILPSQFLPVNHVLHWQWYSAMLLASLLQTAPFWQGFKSQGKIWARRRRKM